MKIKYWFWKTIVLSLFLFSYLALMFSFFSISAYSIYFNIFICFAIFSLLLCVKPKYDILVEFILIIIILTIYTYGQTLYLRSFKQLAYLNTVFSLKEEGVKSVSSISEFIGKFDIYFLVFPIIIFIVFFVFRKHQVSVYLNKEAVTKQNN